MFDDLDDEGYSTAEEAAEEILEEIQGEESVEEDDSMNSVEEMMSEAEKRVEEANLFKLLISHSFFAPDSARPEVLASVNKKIKRFAIKELELLLGLKTKETEQKVVQQSPFSPDEVSVLKMLVSKALGKNSPQQAPAPAERKPEIMQITQTAPKVNPIEQRAPNRAEAALVKKAQPQQAQQKAKAAKKPASKGFAKPNQQTKVKKMPTADQLLRNGLISSTPPVVSAEGGVSSKEVNKGKVSMSNIVNQLTGGQALHVDNSNPADSAMDSSTGQGDVNERY